MTVTKTLSYPVSCMVILLLSGACDGSKEEANPYLFKRLSPETTGITFSNDLRESADFNIIEYLYFYNGGGIAAGDINNDGLVDLYFSSNQGSNRLYLNKGNLRFEDITERAGTAGAGNWKTGVTMGDVNADGLLDIFVCGVGSYKKFNGRNLLYINNGDLTFTERAQEFGLDFQGFSSHAVFFDSDNDGDLDLFVVNHAVHSARSYGDVRLRHQSDRLAGDKLYRNELVPGGALRFTEVTSAAGISSSQIGYGLAVAASDFNNDGYQDLYVCNDFHENDYLYVNQKNGAYSQELERIMPHCTRFSMGAVAGDINNDGWNDIITLDMQPADEAVIKTTAGEDPYDIFSFKLRFGYHYQFTRNALQLNRGLDADGRLLFSDIAALAGVEATDWSWASLLADFDNDGLLDIYVSNGIVRRPNDLDYINYISTDSAQLNYSYEDFIARMPEGRVPDYFFRNRGDLKFESMAGKWWDARPDLSNGAAYADLDNDGDLDLVVNHIGETASVYENTVSSEKRNYLRVRLQSTGQNTFGIGARITLHCDGKRFTRDQMLSRGWQSSVDPVIHFGLGSAEIIDSVVIAWPGGTIQKLDSVKVNQLITIVQNGERARENKGSDSGVLFSQKSFPFSHRENAFVPFNTERLLPHALSSSGPPIAIADIDRDGLEDVFAGGARGQVAGIFIQQKNGSFKIRNGAFPPADSVFEDTDAEFLDADLDGDLDLVVTSGGQEFDEKSDRLLVRLYLNDGRGTYSHASGSLPGIRVDASCVRPADVDSDGDSDLFVGGQVIAGKYGVSPRSFLLLNDGTGRFSEGTQFGNDFSPGMVSDAIWTDVNHDKRPDLIIAGEWMGISLYLQDSTGEFRDRSSEWGLSATSGIWNCLAAADLDNDGDVDVVAGNVGANSRLRASPERPLRLFTGDIDSNGGYEQILTYYNGGRSHPFISRDQLVKQVPPLKRKFLRYGSFKDVTVEDIIGKELMPAMTIRKADMLESVVLLNDGSRFSISPLPVDAQLTPLFALSIADVDKDGLKDIVGGGNLYEVAPDFGRYDAGYGIVLRGDGRGGFVSLDHRESGFLVRGQIREIKTSLNSQGQLVFVVGRNNDSVLLFNTR